MNHARWSDYRDHSFGLSVGFLTAWHAAMAWSAQLVFALLVAVLTPRMGRLFDAVLSWVGKKLEKKK